MARNVEIKARVRDPARLHGLARKLAGGEGRVIRQDDTFFRVPHGRLKLRRLDDGAAELIHYQRDDSRSAAVSAYTRVAIADPASLESALAAALGVRAVVRKTRTVYLVGQTRIHVDRVAGLGDFAELEVVLGDGDLPERGRLVAIELMGRLEIAEVDLVGPSYVDLVEPSAALPDAKIRPSNSPTEGNP